MSFFLLFALALLFWFLASALIGHVVGLVFHHGNYEEDFLRRERLP